MPGLQPACTARHYHVLPHAAMLPLGAGACLPSRHVCPLPLTSTAPTCGLSHQYSSSLSLLLKGEDTNHFPTRYLKLLPVLCSTSRCNFWKKWSHLAISSSLPLPLQSTSVRLLAQHSIKTKPANGPPVSPPALPRAAPGAPHSLQRKSQSLHCKSGPALYLLCFQRILLPLSPLLTPLKPPPGSG